MNSARSRPLETAAPTRMRRRARACICACLQDEAEGRREGWPGEKKGETKRPAPMRATKAARHGGEVTMPCRIFVSPQRPGTARGDWESAALAARGRAC